jgi:hypothetical protein
MRNRIGFDAFLPPDKPTTTFTIDEASGSGLTELLIHHSYHRAKKWRENPPTYHIEVKVTTGDLESSFSLKPAILELVGHATQML